MRYPVDDEFAIALSRRLYELLAGKGQPLARAVGIALQRLMTEPGAAFPALSAAAPSLFGATAAGLRLAAPPRQPTDGDFNVSSLKMAGFPPQPDRFVGRTRVMARASAALAAESGQPGVLLHGMPGGGKTACALELAYNHEHAFDRLVWYKAPDEGMDITGSLMDFALTLERYLPGFQMAHELVSAETLDRFLPKLTELAEQRRLLLVIDNAESLLTEGGHWRDDNWANVIAALTDHAGLGRVILTSRRMPIDLLSGAPHHIPTVGRSGAGVETLSVDALSPDEALLLARELPDLRRLIYDELPGLDRETSRRLALGVLNIAQGHPKLLELANGQAAHPDRLAALVEAGDQAWREHGGLPDDFFATAREKIAPTGQAPVPDSGPTAAAEDYWHVLAAWTKTVTDTLTPGEQTLFWFLCCLEEGDRERNVLDGNWADLWRRLGRDGQPPEIDAALAAIAARGLITGRAGASSATESYAIHPGVTEAGRTQAGQPFRDAVDSEAANYWDSVYEDASGDSGDGNIHTGMLIRAGLAAVPYHMRLKQWNDAAILLEAAFASDPSRANAVAVLPTIQQITGHAPLWMGVLGRILEAIDLVAAETTIRSVLTDSLARCDYWFASVAAERLARSCRHRGRLAEALHLARQVADYNRLADLGPWTQLDSEMPRLEVLNEMGRADQVLNEVGRLRARMDALPTTSTENDPKEQVRGWEVRERLLDVGREAARQLGRWAEALELNAAILASERDRRAPARSIALSRFNDYEPLLNLARTDEVLALLLEVRQVFQEAHDIEMLGFTLSALADTEVNRSHGSTAIRLERESLRYKYLAGSASAVADSYYALGHFLARNASQPAAALASHLTGTLIYALTGFDGAINLIDAAAEDLRQFGADAVPPRDIAELCDRLADILGTDLPGLIATLSPNPETAEQTLRDLIAQARELAASPDPGEPS